MNEIIQFWFDPATKKKWWAKDPEFDQLIKTRFEQQLISAKKGELNHWQDSAEGCLALVILLDQFSRNIYRDQPESFAQDQQALDIAAQCIEKKLDQDLPISQRPFLYMPYMHSEDLAIHNQSLKLFENLLAQAPEDNKAPFEYNLDFAIKHRDIIEKFGRYPHRNKILGRSSSEDEQAFLTQPGSSF